MKTYEMQEKTSHLVFHRNEWRKQKKKKTFPVHFPWSENSWKLQKVLLEKEELSTNWIISILLRGWKNFKLLVTSMNANMKRKTSQDIVEKCIYGWDYIPFMIYLYSECANKTLYCFCQWLGLELMQTHSCGEIRRQ